jgi:serine/threonine protein kinase
MARVSSEPAQRLRVCWFRMTEPAEPTLLDVRAGVRWRVAIKVFAPELAVDDAYRLLFLHEARTVAALTHPNIVPIHAVGEVGDFVLFVMAYVEGDTLRGGPQANRSHRHDSRQLRNTRLSRGGALE